MASGTGRGSSAGLGVRTNDDGCHNYVLCPLDKRRSKKLEIWSLKVMGGCTPSSRALWGLMKGGGQLGAHHATDDLHFISSSPTCPHLHAPSEKPPEEGVQGVGV